MAQVSMHVFGDRVAKRLSLFPAVAREAVRATFAELADALAAGERVYVPGVGEFGPRRVAAKTVRHPRTHQVHEIEEHCTPRLKASATLKRRMRGKTECTTKARRARSGDG